MGDVEWTFKHVRHSELIRRPALDGQMFSEELEQEHTNRIQIRAVVTDSTRLLRTVVCRRAVSVRRGIGVRYQ